MSGSRRGRRHGWERERQRQEREKKKREREIEMGERKIETGAGERDRQRDRGGRERERERDRGEREKITNTKNSCNFILSYFTPQNGVKHASGLQHDKCRATIQSDYQRQGGKEKDREREKDITRGDRNGPVLL